MGQQFGRTRAARSHCRASNLPNMLSRTHRAATAARTSQPCTHHGADRRPRHTQRRPLPSPRRNRRPGRRWGPRRDHRPPGTQMRARGPHTPAPDHTRRPCTDCRRRTSRPAPRTPRRHTQPPRCSDRRRREHRRLPASPRSARDADRTQTPCTDLSKHSPAHAPRAARRHRSRRRPPGAGHRSRMQRAGAREFGAWRRGAPAAPRLQGVARSEPPWPRSPALRTTKTAAPPRSPASPHTP